MVSLLRPQRIRASGGIPSGGRSSECYDIVVAVSSGSVACGLGGLLLSRRRLTICSAQQEQNAKSIRVRTPSRGFFPCTCLVTVVPRTIPPRYSAACLYRDKRDSPQLVVLVFIAALEAVVVVVGKRGADSKVSFPASSSWELVAAAEAVVMSGRGGELGFFPLGGGGGGG